MTAPIDFAAIMSRVIANHPGTMGLVGRTRDLANTELAARIPERCPDCEGRGFTYDLRCDNCGGSASLPLEMQCANHLAKPTPCTHPSAPTIGDALTEWAELSGIAAGVGVPLPKLVAIGAAVMTGVRDGDVRLTASGHEKASMGRDELWEDAGRDGLLCELRAVEP